ADAHRAAPDALLGPALGRTAAARGRREGAGHGARRDTDGRAALEPRRAAAPRDARRAQGRAGGEPDDDDLRHPRPGRGHVAGRPHRRHERGRDRAGLDPRGGLPRPRRPLRRQLHRQPADELHHRDAARRRRVGRRGPAPARPRRRRAPGVRRQARGRRRRSRRAEGRRARRRAARPAHAGDGRGRGPSVPRGARHRRRGRAGRRAEPGAEGRQGALVRPRDRRGRAMSGRDDVVAQAEEVLRANDRGGYTVPTAGLYPFQWNWDSCLTALGQSHFDEERAWREVETLFAHQWEDGMVPHIVFHEPSDGYFPGPEVWGTGRPTPTSGITQPPVAGFVVRRLFERARDRGLAEVTPRALLGKVAAWPAGFYRHRDPRGEGLVAPPHPWASGRDNSVDWDEPLARVPTEGVEPYTRR